MTGLASSALLIALVDLLPVGCVLFICGLRGRRVGDEPRCRKCGYNLTGLTSERCPECGTAASGKNVVVGIRRRRVLAPSLLLFLLFLDGLCFGEDQAATERVTLKPTHVIEFDDGPMIGRTVFSADGKSIYVLLQPEAVNIWSLLVYRWPEILGVVVGGVILITVLIARRAARRKLIRGKPHCRECSYCLEGCPSDICPECGHDHSRKGVVVGKPLWRRLTPILAPALLVAVGYLGLMVAHVPRKGVVNNWLHWWSVDCLEWAKQRGFRGIVDQARRVGRIVEVDVSTGVVVRRFVTLPGGWGTPIACSPDGSMLIAVPGRDLVVLNPHSGRIIRRLSAGDRPSSLATWTQLDGFSRDGDFAYAVELDWLNRDTRLVKWNLQTGEAATVFEAKADRRQSGGFERAERRLFHVDGESHSWVLNLPSGPVTQETDVEMLLHDLDADGKVARQFTGRIWFWRDPIVSPDGCRVYWEYPDGRVGKFRGWNLRTGEEVRLSAAPGVPETELLLGAYAPGPEFVFFRHHGFWGGHSLVVFDLREDRFIAAFPITPTRINADSQTVSPDGRALAVVGWTKEGPVRNRKLYLYDLSVLDHILSGRASE